jgi:hypothetical protein
MPWYITLGVMGLVIGLFIPGSFGPMDTPWWVATSCAGILIGLLIDESKP